MRLAFHWSVAFLGGSVSLGAQAVLLQYPVTRAVALVGDLDGDGLRDLGYGPGIGPLTYISSRTAGVLLQLSLPPGYVGFTGVVGIGDTNGDGVDDLLLRLGASLAGPQFIAVASGATGAILYTSPYGLSNFSYFASLGDINGNGTGDFAFGDPYLPFGGIPEAGQVEVVDGGTWATIRIHGGSFYQHYFSWVRALDDVNGDGAGDYAVLSYTGFQVYSGATGQVLYTVQPLSYTWGQFLLPIGDFDADGFGDFAVNDYDSPPWSSTYERVIVYSGLTGALRWSHTFTYSNPGPVHFGSPIRAAIGDIDNDGYADAPFDGGLSGIGATAVSGRNQAFVREYPVPTMPGTVGQPYGSPGDFDGDGTPDVLTWIISGTTVVGAQLMSGQAPGVTAFGIGCPSATGSPPEIGISVGARLGRTMSVNLSRAPTTTSAALLGIGFSNQFWGSTSLPLDLAMFGLSGCSWFVSPDVIAQVTTASQNGLPHHASHPIAIPNNTQFLGINLYCQWLVLESLPGLPWASVTRALRTTVVP